MEAIVEEKLLTSATDTLVHSAGFTEHTTYLELLEGVAIIRYCLRVVAEVLQLHSNQEDCSKVLDSHTVQRLLEECR